MADNGETQNPESATPEPAPFEPQAVEPQPAGPEEPPPPRPQTSWQTKALVILNLLATLGLGFLLYLDIAKRQEWARAVFLRDLAMLGLPLDDKDPGTNPEAGTQPTHQLDSALLREAYKARGGTLSEKFLPVQENFKAQIRVTDLNEAILAAHFAGAGKPVSTLKAEVQALKLQLPAEIDRIASEVADKAHNKSAAERRALARKILFPLCSEGWEVVAVEKKINDTPDGKLDELIESAVQRRLLFDILQPLEVFLPTAPEPGEEADKDVKFKKPLAHRAAELDKVKVDDLKEELAKRCHDVMSDNHWMFPPPFSRDNAEKRRSAAFLMALIGQVEIPGADRAGADPDKNGGQNPAPDKVKKDEDQPDIQPPQKQPKQQGERQLAFPKAQRRAEVVCGLVDFSQACADLAAVSDYQEKLLVQAIRRDLGNFQYPLAARLYSPKKFVDELAAVMDKMKIAVGDQAAFRKAIESKLAEMHGKLSGSEKLNEELKKILETQQVVIGSPLEVAAFERAVDGLFSANAIGFLDKHHLALKRIQDLALAIQGLEDDYVKLKDTHDKRDKQLQERIKFESDAETGMVKKLRDARAKTRQLALLLREKQQELFLAQRQLANGLEYNLYLAGRLEEVEKANAKGGKAP